MAVKSYQYFQEQVYCQLSTLCAATQIVDKTNYVYFIWWRKLGKKHNVQNNENVHTSHLDGQSDLAT